MAETIACCNTVLRTVASQATKIHCAQEKQTWDSVADVVLKKTMAVENSSGTGKNAGNGDAKQWNQLLWTSMISQHVKSGQARQALEVFRRMQDSGGKPSTHAFVAALKACCSLQDLETARSIHSLVVECGLDSDVYVGTMLIDVYAKCGSLVNARRVFEAMPQRNVVSWSAMISGYAQVQQGKVALQLYEQMQHAGVIPNDRTYVGVLKACSSLAGWEEGTDTTQRKWCIEKVRTIHQEIVRGGFESDVFVGNMLLDVYAKCGCLPDARRVFERMPRRSVVSWSAMIFGYAQMEQGEEALKLFARMKVEGIGPNDRTYVSVLKAYSSLAALEEENRTDGRGAKKMYLEQVKAIHSDLARSGFESNSFVANMLVDVYAKCGSLVDATVVFNSMQHRNVVSWTSLILGHAQMEEGEEALHLYFRMEEEGVVPNDRTYVAVLKACSSLASSEDSKSGEGTAVKRRCLDHVNAIHVKIIRDKYESNLFVGNMLVDVYAKCGSLLEARRVFESLPRRNVVSWNSMILGYAQTEDAAEEALNLFARMQSEDVVPDERTFLGAIKACSYVGDLERGKFIHSLISKAGLKATQAFVASCLIDMYGKCGSMVDAQLVFDALPARDIVVWNALLAGYARQGNKDVIFHLFEKLTQESVRPNGSTFLSVFTVCNHAGLVDEGRDYWQAMSQEFGISPALEHYSCMIDLLGRAGQVDAAMAMAKNMPFQADAVVWESVLGACQKWKKVDLGKEAFQYAVKLDSNDAAAYVLMSNIYAGAGMWEEADSIQAMRVKAGAWKQPGQTLWTDVDGVVHAFVVGVDHPESQDINENLGNLLGRMKEEGIVWKKR